MIWWLSSGMTTATFARFGQESTQFCPYASEPCHDKFTLFQTAEDMAESKNPGVLFLDADHVRVRMVEERDYDLSTSDNDLPVDIEALIFTIRDKYSYLFA